MEQQENGLSGVWPSHPELTFSDVRPSGATRFGSLAAGIDLQFTYDGRTALYQLFLRLAAGGRRIALLPAFHCPTVVEPAIRAGLEPRFYRVGRDLSIDAGDFLRRLDRDVAGALVINYFGFPASLSAVSGACRDNGTPLVEDCAHSFLSAAPIRLAGDRADFAVYSFKKLVPSSVGGGIRFNAGRAGPGHRLRRPPAMDSVVNVKRLLDQAIDHSDSRLLHAGQRCVNSLYRGLRNRGGEAAPGAAAAASPINDLYPFVPRLAESRMPRYASRILRAADLAHVVEARQRNYRALRSAITSLPAVDVAENGPIDAVCPWALAVRLENRSVYDRRFRARGVPLFTFGETLHDKLSAATASAEALDDARYLAANLLCFSIHQLIPERAMAEVFDVVADVLRK